MIARRYLPAPGRWTPQTGRTPSATHVCVCERERAWPCVTHRAVSARGGRFAGTARAVQDCCVTDCLYRVWSAGRGHAAHGECEADCASARRAGGRHLRTWDSDRTRKCRSGNSVTVYLRKLRTAERSYRPRNAQARSLTGSGTVVASPMWPWPMPSPQCSGRQSPVPSPSPHSQKALPVPRAHAAPTTDAPMRRSARPPGNTDALLATTPVDHVHVISVRHRRQKERSRRCSTDSIPGPSQGTRRPSSARLLGRRCYAQ